MEGFNRESRQSIFFGISHVIASPWSADTIRRLDFQRILAQQQLDFPQTSLGPHEFSLVRAEPSALQVKVASSGPQVSTMTVSAKNPVHGLELFSKEAEAVYDAYRQTWLGQQCQILQCSARIQHLYSCQDHAFKYLWEQRLGQRPDDFRHLGKRPVLGGGLRLFMPPMKEDKEPVQIEVKIESFLRGPKKMFVETVFVWPKPRLLTDETSFDTGVCLRTVEKYATEEVCRFIEQGGPEQWE
ncbi:MAG: hypothetical protein ACYTEL_21300 [Planctomycetota bacterium]|jgi:hypothetical protein